MGFGAARNDVFAGLDGARGDEADEIRRVFRMLDHEDGIGTHGNGRAGHDLPNLTNAELAGASCCRVITSAKMPSQEQQLVSAGFSGTAGEAVSGGPGKWGLIAIRVERLSQHAARGLCERNRFYARVYASECCRKSFCLWLGFAGKDAVSHGLNEAMDLFGGLGIAQ